MHTELKIIQSNGYTLDLSVELEDNKFHGDIKQSKSGISDKDDNGKIYDGFIDGNQIKFTAVWTVEGRSIGEYNGIIGLDRRIYGIAIETTSNEIVYWISAKPMKFEP